MFEILVSFASSVCCSSNNLDLDYMEIIMNGTSKNKTMNELGVTRHILISMLHSNYWMSQALVFRLGLHAL